MNIAVLVSLFYKVAGLKSCNVIKKEILTHWHTLIMFSFELCKIFKNSYFKEHLWMPASGISIRNRSFFY